MVKQKLIGYPEEKATTYGYIVYPESYFAKMKAPLPAITVTPPEVKVEVKEEKPEEVPEVRRIAEEVKEEGIGKYIPWIILAVIVLGGKKK